MLVGHSLGGLTIAEVARRAPSRVAHLVFVSCLIPPDGQCSIDALPVELRQLAADAASTSARDGVAVGRLDDDTIRAMFCNDMNDEQTAFVLDHVGSEVPSLLAQPVTRQGIPSTVPSTYVRLGRDASLAPEVQDAQIAALRACPGGPVDVVDLNTGHDVMISAPAALARVLDRVAT